MKRYARNMIIVAFVIVMTMVLCIGCSNGRDNDRPNNDEEEGSKTQVEENMDDNEAGSGNSGSQESDKDDNEEPGVNDDSGNDQGNDPDDQNQDEGNKDDKEDNNDSPGSGGVVLPIIPLK